MPSRLRTAVTQVLAKWGYTWSDVSFAGTALLPPAEHWQLKPGAEEVWVLAVTAADALAVGDRLESASGRATGLAVSAFSGGVIPVTPYYARVYEFLGRHGGGGGPAGPSPSADPTTPDTDPATPDRAPASSDTARAAPDRLR